MGLPPNVQKEVLLKTSGMREERKGCAWGSGAAVSPASAQALWVLLSHPHGLPPDVKACTHSTFSSKLLYVPGFTQCQEKKQLLWEEAVSQKEESTEQPAFEDILKMVLSPGNAQHHPFRSFSTPLSPAPPEQKDMHSAKRLQGYVCQSQPVV